MTKTVDQWSADKGTPKWLLAMVKTEAPQGKQLSEADYDALCQKMQTLPIAAPRTRAPFKPLNKAVLKALHKTLKVGGKK